jgi:hypothetical protein
MSMNAGYEELAIGTKRLGVCSGVHIDVLEG